MKKLVAVIVVVLLAGMFGAAWAQEITGQIRGIVTDASGGVIAKLRLRTWIESK